MSANPNNPGLELAKLRSKAKPADVAEAPPGRDALQALLAFSSLHEQLRQRRSVEALSGTQLPQEDPWKLEQFVLDDVLHLVAERAMTITGADGVAIAFAEGDAIVCRASVGQIVPDAGVRLDPNSAFSGTCFRTASVARCDDTENDTRVSVQACRRLGALSIVAVPLLGRHNVLGLIEAFSTRVRGFDDNDIRTLRLLAELILAAIKPEEEDRLAEISRQVVERSAEPKEEISTYPSAPRQKEIAPSAPLADVSIASPSIASATERVPFQGADLPFLADQGSEENRVSRPLLISLLAVVVVLAAGGIAWWKMQRPKTALEDNTSQSQVSQSDPAPAPKNAASQKPDPTTAGANSFAYPVSGETGTVTGIRHWSAQESSTVVIDLQKPVQYEAHRISNPDRIYFDLDDTSLAASLYNKVVDINDSFLQRLRIAQPTKGVTRVVLETKSTPSFSVSLEQNPYRLVVEVRKNGTQAPARTKADLFGPTSNPSVQAENSAPVSQLQAASNTPKFRIVLDAGHGGWDLGTVGRSGLLEKDLVLDIVDRLGKLVESRLGADVIYTRTDDTYISLEKRTEIANLSHADLFLSVHANYSDLATARGVETYYTNTYSSVHARTSDSTADTPLTPVDWTNVDIREKVRESRKFAETVQHSLYGSLAEQNPGLRDRGVKEASYVVLTGTTMPAILNEVSFISSPADERNLESPAYRQKIAQALYKGVERYAESLHHDQLAGMQTRASAQ
ncbi:MAG TPA: N-acetylmuramoyl-L-alanine amidase [Terriglobales bacterium]|jgi:N-acetylmuramoyl-L-alanine amidase